MNRAVIFVVCMIIASGCKRRYDPPDDGSVRVRDAYRIDTQRIPEIIEKKMTAPYSEDADKRSEEKQELQKDLADLYEELSASVFVIIGVDDRENITQGSAFLIRPNVAVTNYHVIENRNFDYAVVYNGEVFNIEKVLSFSPTDELDYAVFEISGFHGVSLKIADSRPRIGEDVFAIGTPRGLENSLTKGTVSGYRGSRIQFDATIDHGSSGGALFNMNGEVVGITTSIFEGKELNFAVDIQQLRLPP